jgi:hypothetical protein
LQGQYVLITAVSSEGSYKKGYDGTSTGFTSSAELAAYYVYTPPVSPEVPPESEYIQITQPNGGELWAAGSTHDITWLSSDGIDFVKIEYTDNNGSSWHNIDGGSGLAPNNGLYSWNIPASLGSTQMKVRISDASDGDPVDVSDLPFTVESITVLVPNGPADKFQVGQAKNVTWKTGTGGSTVITNVKIELSKNGSAGPFTTLPGGSNVPNTGSFSWTPLVSNITTTGRIRITDVSHSQFTDMSDADFEVFQKHELTLAEYLSYFTGGSLNYRGRTYAIGSLSQSYYNGTYTSWDFTSAPLSNLIGTTTFQMTFANANGIPRIAGAYNWLSTEYGMRTTAYGPANRRPWWVFNFESSTQRLYPTGTTYYQDARLAAPYCLATYEHTDMTEQFDPTSSNDIQFPQDADSTGVNMGGTGYLDWVNHQPLTCTNFNDWVQTSYTSGSRWEVVAFGDVKVPQGGGTSYPYCLLIRLRLMYDCTDPYSDVLHTGQIMYQWIDTDSGMVVAFIQTHNENGALVGLPVYTNFSGDAITGQALIAARY